MPKTVEYQNPEKVELVKELNLAAREKDASIWKAVAEKIGKSAKNRCEVNVWKINKNTSDGDTVIVPGKVLGEGVIDHGVLVAAFKVSCSAKKKIESAGGKVVSIRELMKKNPTGSGVRILG